MTTPPYQPTDLRRLGSSQLDVLASHPDDDLLPVSQLTVRLDRITVGHDELHEALAALTEALRPILGSDPHAEGDDQPEMQPDGGSELAAKLAVHASNAWYLAARVRAITAAVDL